MITQRRNRYNSQSADDGAGSVIVDDLYKYHALVDDDDGGCDEESKINDIGIEHSDVDDDEEEEEEEEEDVDRFRVHSVCKATLCKSYSLNWHCHDIPISISHCSIVLKSSRGR